MISVGHAWHTPSANRKRNTGSFWPSVTTAVLSSVAEGRSGDGGDGDEDEDDSLVVGTV